MEKNLILSYTKLNLIILSIITIIKVVFCKSFKNFHKAKKGLTKNKISDVSAFS
jgi:hypothetical protein